MSSADIEEVADAKSKSGCDVTKICYDDSKHAAHLSAHRESYVAAVNSFLVNCLKRGEEESDATTEGKKDRKEKDS